MASLKTWFSFNSKKLANINTKRKDTTLTHVHEKEEKEITVIKTLRSLISLSKKTLFFDTKQVHDFALL